MKAIRTIRRMIVGAVLLYLGVVLLLGPSDAAKPVFRGLAIAWCGFLLWNGTRQNAINHTEPQRIAQPVAASMCLRTHHAPRDGFITRSVMSTLAAPTSVIEVLASNVALSLLAIELVLRTYAACTGDLYWIDGSLDAHRLIPGHNYGNGLRGNRLGYPGAEFELTRRRGITRIAALGDSFAVGCAVPYSDNYLSLLQRQLDDAEIYNFGVSGAGPREYLTILRQDVLAVQPDLVLVNVFVGNDITETLATPRGMDVRNHAVWHFGKRVLRMAEECRRRSADLAPLSPWGRGVGGEGAACVIPSPLTPSPSPPRGEGSNTPALSHQTFREIEARRLELCLAPPTPALERKWQRCFDHLRSIVETCKHRNIRVAIVLIPDEFQVNNVVLKQAINDRHVALSQIDLDLPQHRLRDFCTELNVPCLDLHPPLTAAGDCYVPRDTHWNAAGHRIAANALADWLKDQK